MLTPVNEGTTVPLEAPLSPQPAAAAAMRGGPPLHPASAIASPDATISSEATGLLASADGDGCVEGRSAFARTLAPSAGVSVTGASETGSGTVVSSRRARAIKAAAATAAGVRAASSAPQVQSSKPSVLVKVRGLGPACGGARG
jgi:hypothetical protein